MRSGVPTRRMIWRWFQSLPRRSRSSWLRAVVTCSDRITMRRRRAPRRRRNRRTRPSDMSSSRTMVGVRLVQPSSRMWFDSEIGVDPLSRLRIVWFSHCVMIATSAPRKMT